MQTEMKKKQQQQKDSSFKLYGSMKKLIGNILLIGKA